MDRLNFFTAVMQLLPSLAPEEEKKGGGGGGGGGRILRSVYWPTASACVAYTVD